MLNKEVLQQLPLEDLSARHRETLGSLEKISRVTASLDNRLANLDGAKPAEIYISAALRIGLVRKALEGKAKPTFLARQAGLEEEIKERVEKLGASVNQIAELTREGYLPASVSEKAQGILEGFTQPQNLTAKEGEKDKALPISQKLTQFFQEHQKPSYLIHDVAQILDFPVYSNSGIWIKWSRLIRETAEKLGIVVGKRGSFSREEVEKIVMALDSAKLPSKLEMRTSSAELIIPEWVTEALKSKSPLVLNGQEITMRGKRKLNTLRILACTSQQRKISSSLLAKALYGDEIPFVIASNRVRLILSKMRRELAKVNMIIVSERIDREARYLGDYEVCYYLTASVPQAGREELSVPTERVEPEKSQPYKLEESLICDLGRVLRAPISWPILEKFGIKFTDMQIRHINQVIDELCDQSKKSQFETSGNIDEVFALLTESLEGFANPLTRAEFLAQNSTTLKALFLSIGFGKIDTVEKLNSLMAELRREFLKS